MDTAQTSANAPKTSRVGKRPIDLPKGVTATINGRAIDVKGPKGSLTRQITDTVSLKQEGTRLHVSSTAPATTTSSTSARCATSSSTRTSGAST